MGPPPDCENTSSTRNRKIHQPYIHAYARCLFFLLSLFSPSTKLRHTIVVSSFFSFQSTFAFLLDTLAFSQLSTCVLYFSSPSRLPFLPLWLFIRASTTAPLRPMALSRVRQTSKMSSRRLRTSSALPASRVLVCTP